MKNKTAEDRARIIVHDIFIIGNNWDSVATAEQELNRHAAQVRREALREAAGLKVHVCFGQDEWYIEEEIDIFNQGVDEYIKAIEQLNG